VSIPESFLDALTERCDITDVVSQYVSLTKKGGNLFGLCPFHNEKTPSFSVSPDKQIYHCFGCGKGGGVINFIMEIENLSFPEAVKFLADRAGMTMPEAGQDQEIAQLRRQMYDLNKEAARWFHAQLSGPGGSVAAAYLDRRRISRKTAVNFGLGYAPDGWDNLLNAMTRKGYSAEDLIRAGLATRGKKAGAAYDKFRNRLMFPVIDIRGEVLGFSGRALADGQEPKYLNSPETLVFAKRRSLYGIHRAKNSKRENIILVEGNIDVVTLHQAGFDNTVAAMGTALTTEQTRLISRYAKEIVLCYDNDPAGHKATERALEILKDSEFTVRVLKLPDRVENGETIKIDADDLPAITIGDSDALKVGEWVLAIGNPFNLTSTVTAGIVSAKARHVGGSQNGIESFIQTDAAINQGNSGGALVNARGELVGINAMLYSQTGSFTGYGFAIPVSIMKKVVSDLQKFGTVQRALLGVSGMDLLNYVNSQKEKDEKFENNFGTNDGVYVAEVVENGAAEAAGLKEGDVIIALGDKKITKMSELQEATTKFSPGESSTVKFMRDGKEKSAKIVFKNANGNTKVVTAQKLDALGAEFKELTDSQKQSYNLSYGVQITSLDDGLLKDAGVPEKFIILKANNQKVTSVSDLEKIFKSAQTSEEQTLWIYGKTPAGQQRSFAVLLANE